MIGEFCVATCCRCLLWPGYRWRHRRLRRSWCINSWSIKTSFFWPRLRGKWAWCWFCRTNIKCTTHSYGWQKSPYQISTFFNVSRCLQQKSSTKKNHELCEKLESKCLLLLCVFSLIFYPSDPVNIYLLLYFLSTSWVLPGNGNKNVSMIAIIKTETGRTGCDHITLQSSLWSVYSRRNNLFIDLRRFNFL